MSSQPHRRAERTQTATDIHTYTCTHIHMHTHTHAHTYTHAHTHKDTCTRVQICGADRRVDQRCRHAVARCRSRGRGGCVRVCLHCISASMCACVRTCVVLASITLVSWPDHDALEARGQEENEETVRDWRSPLCLCSE